MAHLLIALILLLGGTAEAQLYGHWETAAPMPQPLANNAVAALAMGDTCYVFSFMGIDTSKIWSGITRNAYRFNTVSGEWLEIAPVPGEAGRIAASAQSMDGKVYIFGGYSVNAGGGETTWANVDIYDPVTDTYSAGEPAPVPVDDQVTGVWRDSLIYSISGWSFNTNVDAVQIYNPSKDTWIQATPIIGSAVFGHTGGLVGDTIIYFDGVRISNFQFVMNGGNFMGVINPEAPDEIAWERIPPHPGPRKYRAAAGTYHNRLVFTGGTGNPYNFDGIGYNGQPSNPDALTFGYNTRTQSWETFPANLIATMDHRGLARCGDTMYLAGGMVAGQQVSNQTGFFVIDSIVPIEDETAPHTTARLGATVSNVGQLPAPFAWEGADVLFNGGMMFGLPPDRVVEGRTGLSDGAQGDDFRPTTPLVLLGGADSTLLETRFNDSRAGESRIGLEVTQRTLSYAAGENAGFLIFDLDVRNIYDGEIDSLLVGGYVDWNINAGTSNSGAVIFDTLVLMTDLGDTAITTELAYVYDAGASQPLMGAAPLSQHRFRASRIADLDKEVFAGGFPGSARQYQWLLERRADDPFGDPFGPADKALIFSLGGTSDDGSAAPGFTISRYDTVRVGFALVGGNSLEDLTENCRAAVSKWWHIHGPVLAIARTETTPRAFRLHQNYPNPFNPSTHLEFEIGREAGGAGYGEPVTLKIYDVSGRHVKTLVEGRVAAGRHEVQWDGTNTAGARVTSGIYFYRLGTPDHASVRQMLLIR